MKKTKQTKHSKAKGSKKRAEAKAAVEAEHRNAETARVAAAAHTAALEQRVVALETFMRESIRDGLNYTRAAEVLEAPLQH